MLQRLLIQHFRSIGHVTERIILQGNQVHLNIVRPITLWNAMNNFTEKYSIVHFTHFIFKHYENVLQSKLNTDFMIQL